MSVYEVEHLTKIYRNGQIRANDDLSFTINKGEFFGLLGDNGAGKSTLVRQMANLLAPTSGTVQLFGQPINCTPLYAPSRIGYMPQGGGALNSATVGEALYFTAHLRGLSRPDARTERDRLINLMDIGTLRDRPVMRLSGGQKRLVLLATAMTASPPVLILDEPTNDLDPLNRVRVWDILRRVNLERGTPEIVKTISLLSPATYAASALRQVVLNVPDRIPFVVDLIVLVAMTVGLLWLVTQKLDWRAHQ